MVALKEDIKRTSKKLKLWERELEDRKTKLSDQHNKVAKLQQDLDQVSAGEPHPESTIIPDVPEHKSNYIPFRKMRLVWTLCIGSS